MEQGRVGSSWSWCEGRDRGPLFPGSVWREEKQCLYRKGLCGLFVCRVPDVETAGSDPNAGFSLFCRVMKLETGCGIATSEVPKPEKEAEPDAEPRSENSPQEARAKSKSGSGLEAEAEPLGAESGPEAKAKFLGANPRSGSGAEAEAEQLDFVVATEREFEEVLAISGGIYGGLDYLPSRYHSWLRDPNRTVVLAKRNGGVVRTGVGPRCEGVKPHLGAWVLGRRGSEPLSKPLSGC